MNFKSPSHAKALILACLAIGLISASYASRQQDINAVQQSKVRKLQAEHAQLRATNLQLTEALQVSDAPPITVDQALAAVRVRMEGLQVPHGVHLAQATLARSNSGAARPIAELAQDVKGTPVKSLRINVRGQYTSYEGLLAWLREVRAHEPVSVVQLSVRENAFELALRVYGT